jgi:hypothetical protein
MPNNTQRPNCREQRFVLHRTVGSSLRLLCGRSASAMIGATESHIAFRGQKVTCKQCLRLMQNAGGQGHLPAEVDAATKGEASGG